MENTDLLLRRMVFMSADFVEQYVELLRIQYGKGVENPLFSSAVFHISGVFFLISFPIPRVKRILGENTDPAVFLFAFWERVRTSAR